MKNTQPQETTPTVSTLDELAKCANYSYMDTLNRDPESITDGADHAPRQVFTGHYVPVKPTPIEEPEYVAHSQQFFHELGIADSLAVSADFMRVFSGDLSQVPEPMRTLIEPGKRVLVPFRQQRVTGYTLGPAGLSKLDHIKQVLDVIDASPLFPSSVIPLFKWAADYYLHPLGEVIKEALPGGINIGEYVNLNITKKLIIK